MRLAELELMLPALYVIYTQDGGATTSDIIRTLTQVYRPTGEDAELALHRNDSYFSQKVRNLLGSHSGTNGILQYVKKPEGRNRPFTLTLKGKRYVQQNEDALAELFAMEESYEAMIAFTREVITGSEYRRRTVLYTENPPSAIREGALKTAQTRVRSRSRALRVAARRHYTGPDGKIRCTVCGFSFEEAYGEAGFGMIEIHHLEPIAAQTGEGREESLADALQKVRPLCANCHRMVHRENPPMPPEELKKLLR